MVEGSMFDNSGVSNVWKPYAMISCLGYVKEQKSHQAKENMTSGVLSM